MTLVVVRDAAKNAFVLVVNGDRIGEFSTEEAAWEFAEDAYSVAQAAMEMECSVAEIERQRRQQAARRSKDRK